MDPSALERLRIASIISSTPRRASASRSSGLDPLRGDPLGQLGDVVALVAVLGQLAAVHPRGDRGAEELDLPAGVVEVVLALDPSPANSSSRASESP